MRKYQIFLSFPRFFYVFLDFLRHSVEKNVKYTCGVGEKGGTMTTKEHKKYITNMKQFANKIATSSSTEVKKLTVNSGIYTNKGNLRKPYK